MTDFNNTNWSRPEFSREFRDNADIYVIERQRLFRIMRSFFGHHFEGRDNLSVLDLGCGDGIVVQEILSVCRTIKATLVDASEDMLSVAGERFKGFENISLIKASFHELLVKDILNDDFDFVVSSLAIHHLTMQEKKDLFRFIYAHLKDGGYFMNIDVLLAPTEELDAWYMKLWQEWVEEQKALHGIEGDLYDDVVRRYKDNRDNKPDTLSNQLTALEEIGFKEVDCYYKYGVFAIFGGRR